MPLQYVFLFRWNELRDAQQRAASASTGSARRLEGVVDTADEHADADGLSESSIEAAERSWPYLEDQRAQYTEFQRLYRQVGVTKLNEHADARPGKDFEWMERQLFQQQQRRKRFGIFLQLAQGPRAASTAPCVARLGRCYQPPARELLDQRVDA